MRNAGTESWRFAHDIDESLHCVLYLRDALGLQIEDEGVIPPRLAGEVPDRFQVLGPASALAAAALWPSWWGAVVNQVAPAQLGPPSRQGGSQNWVRGSATWPGPVVDPPEWVSLEASPALRDAARTLWIESCRWFGPAREPYLPPSCRDVFAWDQVRDAAERAAIEREVTPGKVNGCAQVLLVEGSWWQIVAPGVALCSIAAARDPAIAPAILKEVFDSYLAR
ncbi:MAG: hypothetical protein M3Y35_04795 [Actinomycetota bacterium]|nr:hypothetical protein [Actinomycetota bacterium]